MRYKWSFNPFVCVAHTADGLLFEAAKAHMQLTYGTAIAPLAHPYADPIDV
jgi:hypothetical protein